MDRARSNTAGIPSVAPEIYDKFSTLIQWSVTSLITDFSDTISLKSTQVNLIRFRLYLARKYPEAWETLFEIIIRRAFPEYAEEIFETLLKMDRYNEWLEDNKAAFPGNDNQTISDTLWAKRRELFGDDADDIWAEETRTEIIKLVLDAMQDDYETDIHEKIDLFSQVVNDVYANETDLWGGNKMFYLTRAFFRMDSVQENLHEMDETSRAEIIRAIRKTMGYSDDAIEKMEKSDVEKETRWQEGYRYMAERAHIFETCQGAVRQRKIADLQETFFGRRAKTIRAEEASGFFRFERPRIYGCN